MPKCTQTQSEKFNFGRIGRKPIVANFDGGDRGSDGGLLLLKSLDEKLGLTRALARAVVEPRNPDLIEHPMQSQIAQRIYALCCGYEGSSDHDRLRHDLILQTALGRDELLGSSPTLCRMENRASSRDAAGLARGLFEPFIHAHASAPDEIVLDLDASDIPLYRDQKYREFHGYAACHREGGEPSAPSLRAVRLPAAGERNKPEAGASTLRFFVEFVSSDFIFGNHRQNDFRKSPFNTCTRVCSNR